MTYDLAGCTHNAVKLRACVGDDSATQAAGSFAIASLTYLLKVTTRMEGCILGHCSATRHRFFKYLTFENEVRCLKFSLTVNLLIPTLKPQSNRPLYSNVVIGTLATDGWTVTFGTARRGLAGWSPTQSPFCCTKCNSPPINGQCTNFVF